MLQLKNIVKSYTVGELTQVALKGISLNFRENECVNSRAVWFWKDNDVKYYWWIRSL